MPDSPWEAMVVTGTLKKLLPSSDQTRKWIGRSEQRHLEPWRFNAEQLREISK